MPQGNGCKCFLSYSRADKDAAAEFCRRLRDAGHDVFMDVEAIRAGAKWIQELESRLSDCHRFVVLIGNNGVTGWLRIESDVALMRNCKSDGQSPKIWPVLLKPTPLDAVPPLMQTFQVEKWAPDEPLPEGFGADDKATAKSRSAMPLRSKANPFRGLAPFSSADRDVFFGRREETLVALSKLGDQSADLPNPELGESQPIGGAYIRWLQVEGNSGCGKSSLVRAGMLPEIEGGALWARTRFQHWRVLGPMMPGRTPLSELALAVQQCLVDTGAPQSSSDLKEQMRRRPKELAMRLRESKQENTAFLLIVDQFEEIFTLADDEERTQFDRQLAGALAERNCPLFVISTIRNDFLDRMGQLPCLFEYSKHCAHYSLPPVGKHGLSELIVTRSQMANVDPSEVTAAILNEARDEVSALPLVENALDMLWRKASEESIALPADGEPLRLSGEFYVDSGGLAGLLESGADKLIAEIDEEFNGKGRAAALEVLLALTRVDPEGQHTRRRISYEEAVMYGGKDGERVLRMLSGERPADAPTHLSVAVHRLVSVDGRNDHPGIPGAATVSLIHETLIRARRSGSELVKYWKQLYDYIDENQDRDLLRQLLEWRVHRWQQAARLWRWARLAYWASLWRFRRLRFPTASTEGRYLRASRWATSIATIASAGLAVPPMAFATQLLWTVEYKLPTAYVVLGLRWHLDLGSIPAVMHVPPQEASGSDPTVRAGQASVFEIGAFEVTFEEYDYFVWSNRRALDPPKYPVDTYASDRGRYPVINVSWDDAQRYVRWLSEKTGQVWRLPTGEQWAYAARAGNGPSDGAESRRGEARCDDCGGVAGEMGAHSVGFYPKNTWGLFDMAGNVAEWVDDRITPEGPLRLARGGGWINERGRIGSEAISRLDARERVDWVGFRVARFAAQPAVR